MANLSPEQLAAAREAQNGSCSALLVTLGHVPDADAAVLGELSVAAVWRLRGVSRAFRGWCGSALAAVPRVVAVGGVQIIGGVATWVKCVFKFSNKMPRSHPSLAHIVSSTATRSAAAAPGVCGSSRGAGADRSTNFGAAVC